MKIIQLVYSLASGGAEKFEVGLSNTLAELGHDVTICMILRDDNPIWTFNRQFINSNVKFHSLQLDEGFSLQKEQAINKYIRKENPDVVHCHLNVIPYIFRLAFFNRHIKFFHTIHSVADKDLELKVQYPLNRFFYRRGLIIPITISETCLNSFKKFYKINSTIHHIDNGCEPIVPSEKFALVKAEVQSYKISDDTVVFVHVARCSKVKNQDLLIDAFNSLANDGINFILLIIGIDFDSKEGMELQKRANSRIHFLGEKSYVGDYMLCADAFCLTSTYEGLPISLVEALSCGITPICTPVGGIPDVIRNGETGYLSASLELHSYVKAIKAFLDNRIEPERLKDLYSEKFSIKQCAKKYIDVFEHSLVR